MKEAKVIKRYQNRKLYDTHESAYVTLDEIAKMIRAGEEVRVIDNKTKNDITASTLTQLLYESERKAKSQPSVNMLKTIIRSGDGSFSGFTDRFYRSFYRSIAVVIKFKPRSILNLRTCVYSYTTSPPTARLLRTKENMVLAQHMYLYSNLQT